MHGIIRTKHFNQRVQQRGLNNTVIEVLIQYGEQRSSHEGIDSLFFSKKALSEIRSDHGPAVFKMCEKLRNTYIIMSEDGVLITVARSHRRTVH